MTLEDFVNAILGIFCFASLFGLGFAVDLLIRSIIRYRKSVRHISGKGKKCS